MKKTAIYVLTLVCLALAVFAGCGKPADTKDPEPTATPEIVARDISEESVMADSILYANELKNGVQCYYDTSDRKLFYVENQNSTYLVNLKDCSTLGLYGIYAKDGKAYLEGGMTPYYENDSGNLFTYSKSFSVGRVNTCKMGYYYYETNIRDLSWMLESKGGENVSAESLVLKAGVENTLHTYSDKTHNATRILYDAKTLDAVAFGYRYTIPKSTVVSFVNKLDSDGFIGFDVKDVGVLGFVLPADKGKTLASFEETSDSYILKIYKDQTGKHSKGQSVTVSHRVYTGSEHTFDALEYEAFNERNPLPVDIISQAFSGSRFSGGSYNTTTGSYKFGVDGQGFGYYYNKGTQNDYYGGKIEIKGDDRERKIYICVNGTCGNLEGACLLGPDDKLLPIIPEVCKNFSGDYGERYYDSSDAGYGLTIYPLVIGKNETVTHTMLNTYQQWGVYRIKQVSSISFHIGYYHLSTGLTESNCIAPYFVFGRDGWTLPDFRGCSGSIWGGQPQYNSVGRLRFVSYKNEGDTAYRQSEYTDALIRSSGLVYADLDYSYESNEPGKFKYTLTHIEYPQVDENRTYYTLDLTFTDDFTVKDARNNFSLFSFDGRFGAFENISYLDENGEKQIITHDLKNEKVTESKFYKLQKDKMYVSLYNTKNGDIMNFAYILKDYEITIGGKKWDGNLGFREYLWQEGTTDLNYFDLVFDEDTLKFKKGDKIHMNFVLLPYGKTRQKEDTNAATVYEDSVLNPLKVTGATVGTIIPHDWNAIVRADNNVAEFTVTGSRNVNSIIVKGFEHIGTLKVEEKIDGAWQPVVLNVEDYDGFQIDYEPDGYFTYSFNFMQENPTDTHTFKVTVE